MTMLRALLQHWPEYLMEGAGLAVFMFVAGGVGTLLEYPNSPLFSLIDDPIWRRILMGMAMGVTAVALIYSPWGQQSGAHLNPAVTLTFLRLGKVEPWDAVFYIASQLVGAVVGVWLVAAALGMAFAAPPVSHLATLPGASGVPVAFLAEATIAFIMMGVVLFATNDIRLSRFTGVFSGCLVATFIVYEAPLSGMSLNPARSFGSALVGWTWNSFWIYAMAPVLGMQLAAQAYLQLRGAARVHCAKVNHHGARRCIFRCSFAALAWLLLLVSVAPVAQATAADSAPRLLSVGMTVSDLDLAARFYTEVLEFEQVDRFEAAGKPVEQLTGISGAKVRVVRLRLGEEQLELTEYLSPDGTAIPSDSRSNDHWFQHIAIVVSDVEQAYRRLREHSVQHVSTAPQRLPDWNPAAGGISAFYFRDPDGHNLELIQYPPGKGSPRWQRRDRLFLGLDHTAIVVAETGRGLAFYRDILGLTVSGESENWGPEQEHLNLVFGARLRITGMAAATGLGVELLQYLTPPGGRPFPTDAAPNALLHWETTLAVSDLDAIAAELRAAEIRVVSSGIVETSNPQLGFRRALLVRDPDGHAVKLVEPRSEIP